MENGINYMTMEEAIQILKDIYPSQKEIMTGEYPHVAESIDLAISSLEKQIPKKPMKIDKEHFITDNCRMCEKTIVIENAYCPSCGQAIEWEETNERNTIQR